MTILAQIGRIVNSTLWVFPNLRSLSYDLLLRNYASRDVPGTILSKMCFLGRGNCRFHHRGLTVSQLDIQTTASASPDLHLCIARI